MSCCQSHIALWVVADRALFIIGLAVVDVVGVAVAVDAVEGLFIFTFKWSWYFPLTTLF